LSGISYADLKRKKLCILIGLIWVTLSACVGNANNQDLALSPEGISPTLTTRFTDPQTESVPPRSETPPGSVLSPQPNSTQPTFTIQPLIDTAEITPSPKPVVSETFPYQDLTVNQHQPQILIAAPGKDSRLTSPIQFSGLIKDTADGPFYVELFGQDGRLLYRRLDYLPESDPRPGTINYEIEFEIPEMSENGRLVVTKLDDFGRPGVINSVDLLLLSAGEDEIKMLDTLSPAIIIQEPSPGDSNQGGSLIVSGLANIREDQALRIQLVEEDGHVVGQRIAEIKTNNGETYGNFSTEVPYQVKMETTVRLVIFEFGSPISPYTYLSSIEVILLP
jgi:hypothetical protein